MLNSRSDHCCAKLTLSTMLSGLRPVERSGARNDDGASFVGDGGDANMHTFSTPELTKQFSPVPPRLSITLYKFALQIRELQAVRVDGT